MKAAEDLLASLTIPSVRRRRHLRSRPRRVRPLRLPADQGRLRRSLHIEINGRPGEGRRPLPRYQPEVYVYNESNDQAERPRLGVRCRPCRLHAEQPAGHPRRRSWFAAWMAVYQHLPHAAPTPACATTRTPSADRQGGTDISASEIAQSRQLPAPRRPEELVDQGYEQQRDELDEFDLSNDKPRTAAATSFPARTAAPTCWTTTAAARPGDRGRHRPEHQLPASPRRRHSPASTNWISASTGTGIEERADPFLLLELIGQFDR